MKRLVLVLSLLAAAAPAPKTTLLGLPGGKTITVEVADTFEARAQGLMDRKSLPKDYGMLFVFPQEGGMQFWMKNTWVSLDIVFIGAEKKVTVIHPRVKPSTKDTREEDVARVWGMGQYVLELPAGYAAKRGLKKGDVLSFEVLIPRQ